MTPTVSSHCIDDGKTRIVAVVEGERAVIHATKYGDQSTVCVTASMHEADARELAAWLLENTRPRKKEKR